MENKQKVKSIAEKVFSFGFSQIIIDLVQDEVEELLEPDTTPDDVGAVIYQASLLLEVFNPDLTKDVEFLQELKASLTELERELTFVNKTLGLDPNQ